MYYVYILASEKDKKFYIGYTSNLENRLKDHELGLVESTKSRAPLTLLGYEAYSNEKDARSRELYFKGGGRAQQDLKLRFQNELKKHHLVGE